MKPQLDLDVERQAVLPGEELTGSLLLDGVSSYRSLSVSLQGEEVIGANSIVGAFVFPLFDHVQRLSGTGSVFPFSFTLPKNAPPSYSSSDLRCQYFLKARLQIGLGHEQIRRLHITLLPQPAPENPGDILTASVEEAGATLNLEIPACSVANGDTLAAAWTLHASAERPSRINLQLAAIEETTRKPQHRKVLWVQDQHLDISADQGAVLFPIPRDAPFSGDWNTFRVHYGFRASMSFASGKQTRASLPIHVYRHYIPAQPAELGIE
jgi:hypothetical protein